MILLGPCFFSRVLVLLDFIRHLRLLVSTPIINIIIGINTNNGWVNYQWVNMVTGSSVSSDSTDEDTPLFVICSLLHTLTRRTATLHIPSWYRTAYILHLTHFWGSRCLEEAAASLKEVHGCWAVCHTFHGLSGV